ncbi:MULTISPECIES: DUF6049 family protein [Actinotignum]|uniref:DUF6049 family protein n=2 Tax=Actinotignum timonense TaxID=1870995 RepID=A0AAW9HD99_9ACTO|nr:MULTISPECIES: DUF6049 family protein [Actinotignum]MBS5748033.1 hypothetical protein [Actinotignum schaalii]MDE1558748.1 DUF6049 family protein [Actinotignum schaalii]MDE1663664.1 DUF6049 family protein [Actinotignum schaalii]MDK6373508.1 DUF6049 family protein [Actinotignum timonense]MDK6590363.1 DUF6049 family protein [Actinotignum timonense]
MMWRGALAGAVAAWVPLGAVGLAGAQGLAAQLEPARALPAQHSPVHALPGQVLPARPAAAPSVEIVDVGAPVLGADATLTLTATVTNSTTETRHLNSVSLYIQRYVPSSRSAVLSFMRAEPAGLALYDTLTPDADIAPGTSTRVTFSIPRERIPAEWGPRGVQVSAVVDGETATDRSFIVTAPGDDAAPAPISAIVPVTRSLSDVGSAPALEEQVYASLTAPSASPQPPAAVPSATSAADPAASAAPAAPSVSQGASSPAAPSAPSKTPTASAPSSPSGSAAGAGQLPHRLQTLNYFAHPGVSAAVDPLLIAGDPERAALQTFASAAGTSVFFGLGADVDAAALTHAGRADKLALARQDAVQAAQTSGFAARSDIAVTALGVDRVTARALRDAGAAALITTDVDATHASWLSPSGRVNIPLAADGSDTCSLSEARGDAEDSGASAAGDANETADADEAAALRADGVLSALVQGYLPSSDEANVLASGGGEGLPEAAGSRLSAIDARQTALALSAATYRELPAAPRAQVVLVDRPESGALPDRDIGAALGALTSAPWLAPTAAGDLLDAPAAGCAQLPEERVLPGEISAAMLARGDAHVTTISTTAALTPAPASITGPVTHHAAQLAGVALRDHHAQREELSAQLTQLAEEMAGAVTVQPSSTINIISENADLPVHVHNSLPVPVGAVVELRAEDFRIVPSDPVAATIPPATSVTVAVPVQASGSGNVTVTAAVTDPVGTAIGVVQDINVRVRAGWETTGTYIIGMLLGVLLLGGIARSLRSGRRSGGVDPEKHLHNLREASAAEEAGPRAVDKLREEHEIP